ncbi:MAG: efflux RND transporter periplasmic adaptor subunit [Pseudomonadota bacterium]
MKLNTISLILLGIPAVIGLAGCDAGAESLAEAEQVETTMPVPVEVGYPVRGDIFATYQATTTIASDGDAPVIPRVPGEVVELLVEEGDTVAQGDVLARLDGKRLELEMLAAKADLERVRGEFERFADLNRRGLVSDAAYDELKYELDALKATYELSKLNFDYSSIRAPIAGVVSARNVKLGQSIGTQAAAFRITDTSELIAYLTIPQTELAKFAAGHAATLSVDSMPGERFEAEVIRVSPTIDARNGTFRATALIDNASGALAPGMFARFEIAYEMHEDAMTIPVMAVVTEDEVSSVYVVNDGLVTRRTIRTGIRAGDDVEVLDGLSDDDQIVFVGHSALREGSRVLASSDTAGRFTG